MGSVSEILKVDFRSLVGHLGRLGVASWVHFEILGCRWGSWEAIRGSFWWSWGVVGDPFWRSGGAPEGLRRAVVAKVRLPLSRPALFSRFWLPKGAQKAPKMEVKSITNGVKNHLTFLFDFLSVWEPFFHDC